MQEQQQVSGLGPRRAQVYEAAPGAYTTRGRAPSATDPTNFTCQRSLGTLSGAGNDNLDCNSIDDRSNDDFAALNETDVIGGASFDIQRFTADVATALTAADAMRDAERAAAEAASAAEQAR